MRATPALAWLGLLWTAAVGAQPEATPVWTAVERARILAHGPWPMAARADPSNRMQGDPEAIVLGRLLFFDAPLSVNGYIACVTCHQPDRGFTDGRARAQALGPGPRNTLSVWNAGLQRWFGWSGAADSLWLASLRALVHPDEMAATPAHVVARLALNDELACRYTRVFGRAPDHADDRLLVNLAKAMAAWQATLITPRTPFDEFRDAIARDDRATMARYPAAAQRGLRLFVGRGNCFMCHSGPAFTNGEFHDTGVPFFIAPGQVDPGRHAGIRELRASRFNRLGPFSDDPQPDSTASVATRHVTLEHRHWGEWRTPGLRQAAFTAPYMHNGFLASLRDVVRHYAELDESRIHADGERVLRRLDLTEAERDDLVTFLLSLSTPVEAPKYLSAPAQGDAALPCPLPAR